MKETIHYIKDQCRKNLVQYALRAFDLVPEIDRPVILDAGCGTGVVSLAVIEQCNGTVYAVDTDQSALHWFREKINTMHVNNRITTANDSVLNLDNAVQKFDIILAEGLLNVIGFEKGLQVFESLINNKGYIIIHDELNNDGQKRLLFKKYNLRLLGSFELNKEVWWEYYFSCLERKMLETDDDEIKRNLMSEVLYYKECPEKNRSIYYVLQKNGF